MPRTLDTNALAKIANTTGLEPIIIITIDWASYIDHTGVIHPNGTPVSYADKDILDSNGNIIIPGKIISVADLDEIITLDNGTTTANITVELLDDDGSIKALYDIHDLHRRPAYVYQYFQGLALTDMFEIFRGEVASPVTWKEGTRTLSFDIISKVYSLEAGFAPEEGQFPQIPPDLIGLPWPLCFGSPVLVPVTKMTKVISGTILNLFGIPDVTLPYKIEILNYIQADLLASYNYYVGMIDVAQDIEMPAQQLQIDYAHQIVNHDAMHQTIEDLGMDVETLNTQITALIAQYDADEGPNRADIEAELNPLKTERAGKYARLQQLALQERNMQLEAKAYHNRLSNVKYEISIINRLRKKCRNLLADYYQCTQQLYEFGIALNNESTLPNNSTLVMVGPQFPQNITSIFTLNGLNISGFMDGYKLSNIVPNTSYTQLSIGPRLSDDVTSFWLADTDYPNVNGMYLLLGGTNTAPSNLAYNNNLTNYLVNGADPIDGRIVKVVQQVGRQVTCQLIPRNRNQRLQKQIVDYSGNPRTKDKFDAAMGHLLTGKETPDQIAEIANTIPRTINPYVMDILQGGQRQIFIELVNAQEDYYNSSHLTIPQPNIDYDLSSFELIYNQEELTSPIMFTDSADTIEQKILNSTTSIDDNDITVTIVKYWSTNSSGPWRILKIEYNGLMRPITLFSTDIRNLSPTNKDGGKLNIRNICTEPNVINIRFNRNCMSSNRTPLIVQSYTDNQTNSGVTPVFNPELTLWYRGKKVTFDPTVDTSDDLQAKIEALPGDNSWNGQLNIISLIDDKSDSDAATDADDEFDEAASPGTLQQNDWQIQFVNVDFSSIFLDNYNVSFVWLAAPPSSQYNKVTSKQLNNRFNTPHIWVEVQGGGAHEYTNNQRQTIIQSTLHKSEDGPAIEKYRNVLRDLQTYMKDNAPGAGGAKGAQEAVYNAMSAYRSVAKKVHQPSNFNDEAYRLINDEEFGLLYDMEVTSYLEWVQSLTELDQDFTDDIDYEFTMDKVTWIKEACPIILPRWVQRLVPSGLTDQQIIQQGFGLTSSQRLHELFLLPRTTQPFLGNIGDTITLFGNFQEKYICNLLPSTIKAVYAYRNVDGIKRLVPVPSQLYIKIDQVVPDVDTGFAYDDQGFYQCTSVTLYQPLSFYDTRWTDGLYVTLISSVGPNVCDVITWIVETYCTGLTVDPTSFTFVWDLMVNYPVNFAVLQKQNALQLCMDIAWQARCLLWLKEDIVYIRYLPYLPTPYKTITKNDVVQGSLELSYTGTEDLWTKLVINWRNNYAQAKDYIMTLRRNLTRYNEVSYNKEIYIYNDYNSVWKSATWWLIKKASTWRICKFKLFMNNIDLETQDVIAIDFNTYTGSMPVVTDPNSNITTTGTLTTADNTISVGPILAIISKATYNSTDFTIDVEAWLPMLAGENTMYVFAYPWALNIFNYWPLNTDIIAGDAGNPLNMQVPSGLTYQYNALNALDTRPPDFGNPNIGDHFDSLPQNLADQYGEIAYTPISKTATYLQFPSNSDIEDKDIEFSEPAQGDKNKDIDKNKDTNAEALEWFVSNAFNVTVVAQVTQMTQADANGNRTVVAYSGGDLYQLKNRAGVVQNGYVKNFDVSKVVPTGTRVKVDLQYGVLTFEIETTMAPETSTDTSGQSLFDNSVPAPGGGFY